MVEIARMAAVTVAVLAALVALEALAKPETTTCRFAGNGDITGYMIANITIPPGTYKVTRHGSAGGLERVIDSANVIPPLESTVHPATDCTGDARIKGAGITWLMVFPQTAPPREANLTIVDQAGETLAWINVRIPQQVELLTYTAAPIQYVADIEVGGSYNVRAEGGFERIEGEDLVIELHARLDPGEDKIIPQTLVFTLRWDPPDTAARRVVVDASMSYECIQVIHLDEGIMITGKQIPLRGNIHLDQSGSCPAQSNLPTISALLALVAAVLAVISAGRGCRRSNVVNAD